MSASDREINGNLVEKLVNESEKMEDLSEYTDADESISAPTEILAEFLSAIMTKDYANALKHCQLILSYEPSNSTVKEFYPLIIEKLKIVETEGIDLSSSDGSESDDSGTTDLSYGKKKSDSDRTTASYSSLEDDDNDFDDDHSLCISETDIRNGNANVNYIVADKSPTEADNSNKKKAEPFEKTKETKTKKFNKNPKCSTSASTPTKIETIALVNSRKKTSKTPENKNRKPLKLSNSDRPRGCGSSKSGSSYPLTGKSETKSPAKTSRKSLSSSIG